MRIINADALINTLQELFDKREKEQMFTGSRGACVTWNDAIYQIKSAPTIDAMSVEEMERIIAERCAGAVIPVRCKDCIFAQGHFTNTPIKCRCGNGTHYEEYFCADGERRTDNA